MHTHIIWLYSLGTLASLNITQCTCKHMHAICQTHTHTHILTHTQTRTLLSPGFAVLALLPDLLGLLEALLGPACPLPTSCTSVRIVCVCTHACRAFTLCVLWMSVCASASFFDFGKPSFHVTAKFGHFENLVWRLTPFHAQSAGRPAASQQCSCTW